MASELAAEDLPLTGVGLGGFMKARDDIENKTPAGVESGEEYIVIYRRGRRE